MPLDLSPTTRNLINIIQEIREEQLGHSTPCSGTSVAALLNHIEELAGGFSAAANKMEPQSNQAPAAGQAPSSGQKLSGNRSPLGTDWTNVIAQQLGPDWKNRITQQLENLAASWAQPSAWKGKTKAGGQEMSGEHAGLTALSELLIHGWDLASATGQQHEADPDHVEAATGHVAPHVEQNPEGSPGMYGQPVESQQGASPMDLLLSLVGRNPLWSRPTQQPNDQL